MSSDLFSQPSNEYELNELSQKDGVIDRIPLLSLDVPDRYIIENLNNTIQKSQDFWSDAAGFNLKNKRLKNAQMLDGRHLAETKLYRHQTPFIDNELYVGADSIISYIAARAPQPEAYPGGDKPESKTLSKHLESYLFAHSKKFYLDEMLEDVAWDSLEKYVGFIKLEWDPNYGENGEIVPRVVDPNHCIVDHLAKKGQEPRFFCEVKTNTVEGLIAEFPDKKKEILELLGIQRQGTQNMTAEVAYREVWFTHYDDDYEPCEAVTWYIQNLVLDKKKNPNWRYTGKNFAEMPTKPYIPIQLGKGDKWIDRINSLEQAIPQQDILNKLGRQVIDNLATANGTKAIDNKAMDKGDAENWTGDPNQSLLLDVPVGKSINDIIAQLSPQIVSPQLIAEVKNCIERIHGILGTPSQFRGDDTDQVRTASESLMIKNQSSGRQDRLVRALDRSMDRYYQLMSQMIVVWYTKKHLITSDGGDGNFDFIEMHRDKVEERAMVRVRTGTSLAFDKSRQEATAQNAAEIGFLAPYDYYVMMHMDNPQKLYDNWAKWKTDPMSLAMDVNGELTDEQAMMDFTALMGGDKIEQRTDVDEKYIEQMRKLMISDVYLKAKRSVQNAVIRFVGKAADSLALRTELEQLSGPPPEQPQMPQQIQATGLPMPPMPQPGMMPQGQPPMGMPPQMPMAPPQGAPMPMGPQPGPMPIPPAGSPIQSIMQTPTGAPTLNPTQPTVGAGQISPF